jgi:hypothetical protein
MAEKKPIEVDEERIMQLMAADVPLHKAAVEHENRQPAGDEMPPAREEAAEPVKPGKRKNTRQFDFEGTFLKTVSIKDRRQLYISGEFYDRMFAYLRMISDGKVNMVGYIHNVLAHHMVEFRDTINELYREKIEKSNKNAPL